MSWFSKVSEGIGIGAVIGSAIGPMGSSIGGTVGGLIAASGGGGGSNPNIPPPPGLSTEELELIKKQTQSLDFYMKTLEEQKAQNKEQGLILAVTSGLYDPVYDANGKLIDATLNATKVAELQDLYSRNTELQTLAADRYERALKGELPVSEGTLAQKEIDFKLLKEAAARKGVTIAGNSLEEAALTPQDSTAGNELVSRLHRTYKIAEDTERRGELSSAQVGTLGASTLSAASGSVSQFNPQGYLGAVEGAGIIQQPFANQRELGYQATLNQAALRQQQQAAQYQLYGQILGAGAGLGSAIALCFAPDTPVETQNGVKDMEDVQLGDVLADGGIVTSVRVSLCPAGALRNYKDVLVTEAHAVLEDGVWVRVGQSKEAFPAPDIRRIVSIGTSNHRIVIGGIVFADEFETEQFGRITLEDSLRILNQEAA